MALKAGCQTKPGQPGTRVVATSRLAFRRSNRVGTQSL